MLPSRVGPIYFWSQVNKMSVDLVKVYWIVNVLIELKMMYFFYLIKKTTVIDNNVYLSTGKFILTAIYM